MKNKLAFPVASFLMLLSLISGAQAPVALHHNGTATMFFTSSGFTDAYNAAVSGDTIYLPGGFFAGLTIDKRLAIIGAGHHPDSSTHTYATQINGSLTLGPDADSTHIEGLHITGHINLTAANNKIDRLRIRRNIIDGNLSINGDRVNPGLHIEISGNVVRNPVDLSNTLNAVVCNNILQTRIHYVWQGNISNNVFTTQPYLGYPIYQYNVIYDCDNSLIENNVLAASDQTLGFAYCDNSVIRKNLFAVSNIDYGSNPQTGNYTGVGAANLMVNWTSASYVYTDNYHLKTPATHLGSDGTVVGIYGGLRPWKEGSLPLNPHIQSKTIADKTDAAGKIQVQVKVVAQSN
jgi:hypothetical protein